MKNKYEFNIMDVSIISNALNKYKVLNGANMYAIDKRALESIIEKVKRIENNIINKF